MVYIHKVDLHVDVFGVTVLVEELRQLRCDVASDHRLSLVCRPNQVQPTTRISVLRHGADAICVSPLLRPIIGGLPATDNPDESDAASIGSRSNPGSSH